MAVTPCAECKRFLVYEAGWHQYAGAISPSMEALAEFKKEYSEEIKRWEETGSSSSISTYLIDRNERNYEQLLVKKLKD